MSAQRILAFQHGLTFCDEELITTVKTASSRADCIGL
jgi:hypothetical protein